jgi:hypothetical protein
MRLSDGDVVTYTSTCVTVLEELTTPGEESYRLLVRDCQDSCYDQVHCPNWVSALDSIGEWAGGAPFHLTHYDTHDEYIVRRFVLVAMDAAYEELCKTRAPFA